ncbi:rRNA N6-adenosine-methyltransferase zcchc4 [Halocaridina rubra]|uniref:rRNA N6-adenosine-methyltransferase zcchc4 n=1 Tax=Halocaridina rubra TaxID=373956 RepID=A0AAN8WZL5_HALRR
MKDQGLGVDVIINDIQSNPRCTHGPTILFERFQNDGTSKRYYACSACRDRKDCPFYHSADQKFTQAKAEVWQDVIKKATPTLTHAEVYKRAKVIKTLSPSERMYCCDCSQLIGSKQQGHHKTHALKTSVSDEQLKKPSTLLPPKESSRFEAQYLFAANSTDILMSMLEQLQARKVLCLGAPRIFETIVNSPAKKMSALLLDIDDRYGAFFSPEQFLCYNMFNHYFFGGEMAQNTYKKFLSGKEKMVVVSDPPFGGRMELLGHNLLTVQNEWRDANKLTKADQLSVLFIFPYFMEPQVLENLPKFTMLDYQVDYDNHPLYSSGMKGMINGSAVRVFVNDHPSLFPLPDEKGYRHCDICNRWVRTNNVHCEKCKGCMSKDGRTYKHCDECNKCVKPSWMHCSNCLKCQPQDHRCSEMAHGAKKIFACHICGEEGHKRMDCPKRKRSLAPSVSHLKKKKQKLEKKMEKESVGKENIKENSVSKKSMKNKSKKGKDMPAIGKPNAGKSPEAKTKTDTKTGITNVTKQSKKFSTKQKNANANAKNKMTPMEKTKKKNNKKKMKN